jgi:hypothetical protein
MQSQSNKADPLANRNQAVKAAYFQMLKFTKLLLSAQVEEPLRYSLIREDKKPTKVGSIIHEFINPLFYLRLECYEGNNYGIHYGIQSQPKFLESELFTTQFVRNIYKVTMASNTTINIEDCIYTDYIIVECSELYEYIEERNKSNHTFEQILYKPNATKRKLNKAA